MSTSKPGVFEAALHALTVGGEGNRVVTHNVAGTNGGKAYGLARTRTGLPFPAVHSDFIEITPQGVYVDRRSFIKEAAAGAAAVALVPSALSALERPEARQEIPARFQGMKSELDEDLNSYEEITTYNNFYEFGTGKDDPAKNSGAFRPRPWTVAVEGHVGKPGNYALEDFLEVFKESRDQMRALLVDPDRNVPKEEEAFAFAHNERSCNWCHFRAVCPRFA